jgi:integrase
MTLGEFYRELAGCAEATDREYQTVLGHWNRLVGLEIDRPDGIGPEAMGRIASDIASRGSPATANKVLRHLYAILRYAKETGVLLGNVPAKVCLKEPRRLPEAWTVDEVQVILAETLRESGTIDALPANRWWYSLLLAIYYCGGRVGAVIRTEPVDLLLDQRAIILRAANQKQRADQYLHLPDQVIAAVAPIYGSRRKRVWPWPYCVRTLHRRFRRLLERAGVRYGQGKGGLFSKLRRTHASYMASTLPRSAHRGSGTSRSFAMLACGLHRRRVVGRIAGVACLSVSFPSFVPGPAKAAPGIFIGE